MHKNGQFLKLSARADPPRSLVARANHCSARAILTWICPLERTLGRSSGPIQNLVSLSQRGCSLEPTLLGSHPLERTIPEPFLVERTFCPLEQTNCHAWSSVWSWEMMVLDMERACLRPHFSGRPRN